MSPRAPGRELASVVDDVGRAVVEVVDVLDRLDRGGDDARQVRLLDQPGWGKVKRMSQGLSAEKKEATTRFVSPQKRKRVTWKKENR